MYFLPYPSNKKSFSSSSFLAIYLLEKFLMKFPLFLHVRDMFSLIPNLRIHEYLKKILFSFETRQNFSIGIKNVAKTGLFLHKKTLCSSFHTKQDFLVKKKMFIRRFGIRENMPRTSYLVLFRSKWDSHGSITTPLKNPSRR